MTQEASSANPHPEPPSILALDIGTSSTRALLFDVTGNTFPNVLAQRPYQLRITNEGEVSVDPDALHQEDIGVDVVCSELASGTDSHSAPQHRFPMAYTKREQDGADRYDIHFQPAEGGTLAYGVRVLSNHANLPNVYDLGLIRWA